MERMAESWLIVGLGNPGPRYELTRHNVGQLVVDELAARRGETFKAHKAGARVAETWLRPGGPKLVLAKPNSFMNVSGGPVAGLAKFYGIEPGRIVVVHDELDIPFDSIKLKSGGGHGGHNGVRDVAKALGTPDFARVRVGIGRPNGRQDPADWVLDPFGAAERKNLPILVADAADAVEQLVSEGLLAAQQKHHAPRV
jgi:PTH1 family peptidyl-tRNA hydrolase